MALVKGTPEWEAWRQKIIEARKHQVFTDETRAKLSEARKNRVFSAETRKKISDAQKGKPRWTDEEKARMSEQRRGKKQSPELIAKRAEATRVALQNPEIKAKMSAAQKGKTVSPETRAKISAGEKGKIISDETRAKMIGRKHTDDTREKLQIAKQAQWQNWSEEKKQAHMEHLRKVAPSKKNYQSWIEEYYAQQLDAQGIVYERQKKIGWYLVDFYIETENRIIEINGCYWHCCEFCGYTEAFAGKREKDARRHEYLKRKGYVVDIVWEHDLPRKPIR